MTLGERIAKIRKERGLTMNELSKLSEVSQTQISYYEADEQKPNAFFLLRIADALETSIVFLLKGDEANIFEQKMPEISTLSQSDLKSLVEHVDALLTIKNRKLQLEKKLKDLQE